MKRTPMTLRGAEALRNELKRLKGEDRPRVIKAIAEARSLHASKIAELEILHRAKMRTVPDPDVRAAGEAEYRHELQRLNDELDRKVRRIREKT